MNELTPIQKRMIEKTKVQEKWKYEAVDLAVDVLLGVTHREKEERLKILLTHLKNMPLIRNSELDLPSYEDIPF